MADLNFMVLYETQIPFIIMFLVVLDYTYISQITFTWFLLLC